MPKIYYFADVDLKTMKIREIGVSETANHTGETGENNVHRIFLTKGQYGKLLAKIEPGA